MLSLLSELWVPVVDGRLQSLESLRVTCRALYLLLEPLREAACYNQRRVSTFDCWNHYIIQPYDRDTTFIKWWSDTESSVPRWHRVHVAPSEEMTFHVHFLFGTCVTLLRVAGRAHSVLYANPLDDQTALPGTLWRQTEDDDPCQHHIKMIVGQLPGLCSWEQAVEAYMKNNGDIVGAIYSLTTGMV